MAKLTAAVGGSSDIDTSPFMSVDMKGPTFDIDRLSPSDTSEQAIATTALWVFQILPRKSGQQLLIISVDFRVPLGRDMGDARGSIRAHEEIVEVEVDPWYAGRTFLAANGWLIALVGVAVALAGVLVSLLH